MVTEAAGADPVCGRGANHDPVPSRDAVDGLREQFSGAVVGPDDAGYDEMRAVHNGLVDKRPALIARCANTADIMAVDEADRIRAAFGPNWDRLVALKRRCDPDNVLHLNQNIDPSSSWVSEGTARPVAPNRRRHSVTTTGPPAQSVRD